MLPCTSEINYIFRTVLYRETGPGYEPGVDLVARRMPSVGAARRETNERLIRVRDTQTQDKRTPSPRSLGAAEFSSGGRAQRLLQFPCHRGITNPRARREADHSGDPPDGLTTDILPDPLSGIPMGLLRVGGNPCSSLCNRTAPQ